MTKKKTTTQKLDLKLLVVALVILLLVIFYPSFKNSSQDNSWKSYSDATNTYTINYPPDWKVSLSESENVSMNPKENLRDLNLEGKEGKVSILWVDQYGGGCPQGYQSMTFGNLKIDNVCHQEKTQDNGKDVEVWNGDKDLGIAGHIGVIIVAEAYGPTATNRNAILRILSTLNVKQ